LNRTDFETGEGNVYETGSIKSTGPKNTNSSNITTTITVPDKSTIILGGLTKIAQGKGGKKIPILGDIPIIGGLFKSIDNTDDQTLLYVFIKANILRPDEESSGLPDLETESSIHRDAFEKWEKQFQEHQDWPGLDVEPMEPERVLEMK